MYYFKTQDMSIKFTLESRSLFDDLIYHFAEVLIETLRLRIWYLCERLLERFPYVV